MKNQIKSFFLLTTLTALLLYFGQLLGGKSGLLIAISIALVMNGISYWYSDKIVLALYRARPVNKEEQPRLYHLVKEVAQAAKLPMPKIYLLPTTTPNAFATGRNPKHSAIAFTQGILELLDDEELKGVIAHELSHIKHRDTLIQTIAATIAGALAYIATLARWSALFGGFGRDNERGGNLLEVLVLTIAIPLAATLLQLALSRSREYAADEEAAKILHNPYGLANALTKLEEAIKIHPLKKGNPSTASLFIVNPFKGDFFVTLLSTHPPTAERIKRLKTLKL